jgi:transposase
MERLHERCARLDVHKDTVVACVRIATGRSAKRKVKTFATTTSGLLELHDWLEGDGVTHVAMEATGVYWKPVWHLLEDSFQLVLANASHIKAVPGRKTDINDATWIADLLAHGLIRASFVPPTPIQELRDVTRAQAVGARAKGAGGNVARARRAGRTSLRHPRPPAKHRTRPRARGKKQP